MENLKCLPLINYGYRCAALVGLCLKFEDFSVDVIFVTIVTRVKSLYKEKKSYSVTIINSYFWQFSIEENIDCEIRFILKIDLHQIVQSSTL